MSKTFEREGARTVALEDLTFEVSAGEYVCIVGRTGSGKSTTLNLMMGLMPLRRGILRCWGMTLIGILRS